MYISMFTPFYLRIMERFKKFTNKIFSWNNNCIYFNHYNIIRITNCHNINYSNKFTFNA